MKQINKTKPSLPRSSNTPAMSTETTRIPSTREVVRHLSAWILLPLRLFLGITFVYAGIQKLTDPQYFNPSTPGYIGKQILSFATGSPIHDFLIHVALPHASLFGVLVACGELAIGIGTLLGLLLRPAAFFGMLLSFVFFLSASWRVHPYFYGADIVFVFCWITMLLAGPESSWLPALDTWLVPRLLLSVSPASRPQLAQALYIVLGVKERPVPSLSVTGQAQGRPSPASASRQVAYRGRQAAMARTQTRRSFLWGLGAGGAGMLAIVWLSQALHIFQTADTVAPPPASTSDNGTSAPANTPGTTSSGTPGGSSSTTIAQVSAVPSNSAVSFTIPSNGDPGVLIHLGSGEFVAYDATCTHAGCPVQYDPGSQHLLCPCHGAEFDPAQGAAVVQGPTNTPLTAVPITINKATGTVSISG